jgi:hypothetical protein
MNGLHLASHTLRVEMARRGLTYSWINRALPADALGDFVRSVAHRIGGTVGNDRGGFPRWLVR